MKIHRLGLALLLSALAICHSSFAADRPNIVLVIADNQGWGDTGYNGHPELKTPNLDEMAAGMRLNRFYTAHFNCSPTRASVMTGRHPHRMGTFSPGSPIRAQELTVAQVLQGAGYATGHFGKWHLNGKNGDRDTKTPPGRAILADDPLSPGKLGFDEWVSADNFFDLDPVLGRNGMVEKFQGDGSDIATDEALKFIRKQAGSSKPRPTAAPSAKTSPSPCSNPRDASAGIGPNTSTTTPPTKRPKPPTKTATKASSTSAASRISRSTMPCVRSTPASFRSSSKWIAQIRRPTFRKATFRKPAEIIR